MNRSKRSLRGLTILELAISVAILAMILAAIAATVLAATGSFKQGMAVAEIETEARRALDRVAQQFTSAQLVSLVPTPLPPFGSQGLVYRRSNGFAAGANLWGSTSRVAFQSDPADGDDGLDNDRDGLVDEGRVVWSEDFGLPTQRDHVLVEWVREYLDGEIPNGGDDNGNGLTDERGLCFSIIGDALTIRLTLERRDPKNQMLTRTVETSIRIRN